MAEQRPQKRSRNSASNSSDEKRPSKIHLGTENDLEKSKPMFVYIKGDSKPIAENARKNPNKFIADLKYVNGGINIEPQNVKCIKDIVRIWCTNTEEQERLLDVAKIGDINVTITLPYAQTVSRTEVFKTYKYVISGVPVDLKETEIKAFAECNDVHRIKRTINGTIIETETCVLEYDEELELPRTLRHAFLSFKIREYISNPMRCKQCQLFLDIRPKIADILSAAVTAASLDTMRKTVKK
jgi:hypothetical protein